MQDDIFSKLDQLLEQRKSADPDTSYAAGLLDAGVDTILKKIGEESSEVIIASKSGENASIIHEIADLWFHCMVLIKHHELDINAVRQELATRFGLSGLEEKAGRKN